MLSNKKKIITFILFFSILFTRFVKINWGDGNYFHPDENNMARAITNFSSKSLDPNFYAYGQFPLYIVYFVIKAIIYWFNPISEFSISFISSVFGLRFLSAIASYLSVYYFYLFSKKIFKNYRDQIIFLFLIIFNPGLIQLAHFGTTESLLVFVFAFNLYYAQYIYSNKKINYNLLFLISLVNGIGIASKISSIILMGPILLALVFKKKFIHTTYYILLTTIFTCLLTPYSLINLKEFLSSMKYETGVASGSIKVFYTNQFLHSIPYWFQTKNIFPYVSGLPVFVYSFFGLFSIFKKKNFKPQFLLFLIPALVYFLYFGQLYTKWVRFMSPIFFIFPLLATFYLIKIKSRQLLIILGSLAILPGILYSYMYLQPDIRTTASKWMANNIHADSKILSEAGNVVDIPVSSNRSFYVNNFDFFSLDENKQNSDELNSIVAESDYIIVPSRRVFKNQKGPKFPNSDKYYKELFSGKLGFSLVKSFQVPNYFLLNPENAEETWTVFDQPKIRIYEKE